MTKPLSTDKPAEAIGWLRLRARIIRKEFLGISAEKDADAIETVCDAAESASRAPDASSVQSSTFIKAAPLGVALASGTFMSQHTSDAQQTSADELIEECAKEAIRCTPDAAVPLGGLGRSRDSVAEQTAFNIYKAILAKKGTRSLAPQSDFCPKCGEPRTSPARDIHCELFHRASLAPETWPPPEMEKIKVSGVAQNDKLTAALQVLVQHAGDSGWWWAAHGEEVWANVRAAVQPAAVLTEIDPQTFKLMDGLEIKFGDDGTWLAFKTNSGNSAVIRLESIADASGCIIGTAIQQWSIDRRASLSAPAEPPAILPEEPKP